MNSKEAFHSAEAEFQLFLWNRIGTELEAVHEIFFDRCGCLWQQGKLKEALEYGELAKRVQEKGLGIEVRQELEMLLTECRMRLETIGKKEVIR